MRTFATLCLAALAATMIVPTSAAGDEYTSFCTPNTMPTGACVSVVLTTTQIYYSDPSVGQTWSYTCTPYGLACVLTPDTTYTYRSATIPWVDTSGTYVWCARCGEALDVDPSAGPALLP